MKNIFFVVFFVFSIFFIFSCSNSDTVQNDFEQTDIQSDDNIQDQQVISDEGSDPDNFQISDTDESDRTEEFPDEEFPDEEFPDEEVPDEETSDGTILIEQIYFAGMNMGEAILIIGPVGTAVLIDTANDGMSPQTAEAIVRRTGKKEIDWLVITHYHNDHIGGFDNLFGNNAKEGIAINKGVISRGMLDIGSDMPGVEDFNEFCTLLNGEFSSKSFQLCEGNSMPCGGGAGGPWGASGCSGLLKGDLSNSEDDTLNLLSFIPLGSGAKIYFTHANGWVAQNDGVISAEKNGITIGWGETDPENARSLGGVLKWGKFRYVFGGDTQGRDIKIEKFIADNSDLMLLPNGDKLITQTGADVVHLNHHGLASSTTKELIDFLFPNDEKSRNAIVGTAGIYVTSPAQSVLDNLSPRLGTGMVWANAKALTSGTSPKLFVANAAVTIQIENSGNNYKIITGIEPNTFSSEIFISTGD